jgi:hypothetical protein
MTVTRLLIALLPSAAVAAGNYAVLGQLGATASCASCVAWLVGGPLVLGLALVFMVPRAAVPPQAEPVPGPAPEPTSDAALRLLGLLQEEGRLVDFLQEDLGPYPDDQIGAAVRGIHDGCRKALKDRLALAPVLPGAEGDSVTVEAGFDPAAIRLTGNVAGAPPFRGVLRHTGWRATDARLPPRPGHDPHLIAPAEVEIP